MKHCSQKEILLNVSEETQNCRTHYKDDHHQRAIIS